MVCAFCGTKVGSTFNLCPYLFAESTMRFEHHRFLSVIDIRCLIALI